MSERKIKILFDTDIGSDLDDAVALSYLLAEPRCDLLGITTVSGDVLKRAQLASVLCKIAQRDVPIRIGSSDRLDGPTRQPMVPQHKVLANWEHDANVSGESANEFIASTIRNNPGEIVMLAVGPLTNIAQLFVDHPDVPRLLKSLQIMGGRFIKSHGLPASEWNIHCDPAAAEIVYGTDVQLHTSIGLDVTFQVVMDSIQVKGRFQHPLLKPVYEMSRIWFKDRPLLRFHDPLAAVAIFDPFVCDYTTGTVSVKRDEGRNDGVTCWQADPQGSHRIASKVYADEFFRSYFSVFNQD